MPPEVAIFAGRNPVGIFNAKKKNNPHRTESQGSDCGGYFDDTNYKLRGKERARFKEMLEVLLSAVPDTLTVDEVAELTGYNRTTILRYVRKKYIYAVNILRNLRHMLLEGSGMYRVVDILYYLLTLKVVDKIPFLSEYLNKNKNDDTAKG